MFTTSKTMSSFNLGYIRVILYYDCQYTLPHRTTHGFAWMHLCHRGIHATKVGSFFVLLILWISCLVSLSSLILHGSWCIHYHSTWAHYLAPYRMAISRDNAEIAAKEIQISLNLFERAEHVLKGELHLSILFECKTPISGKFYNARWDN